MNLKDLFNKFSDKMLCFIEVFVNNQWEDLELDDKKELYSTSFGLKFPMDAFVRQDFNDKAFVKSLNGNEYQLRIKRGATFYNGR